MLKQKSYGINWTVEGFTVTPLEYWDDVAALQRAQKDQGLVIEAHPSIHSFPWHAPPNIANRHVLGHIKRQAYCNAKMGIGSALEGLLQKLQTCADQKIGSLRLFTKPRISCGITKIRSRSFMCGSIIGCYSNSSFYFSG